MIETILKVIVMVTFIALPFVIILTRVGCKIGIHSTARYKDGPYHKCTKCEGLF